MHGFRVLSCVCSQAAVHAPHCMCLRAQLVSLGPAVHQAALKIIYVHSNGKESGKEREDLDLCLNLLEEEA